MNAILPFPHAAPPPDQLLPERDILSLRPCLSHSRLSIARAAKRITWTRGKRGTAWYRLADVDRFIREEMETQCRDRAANPSSNSADNGSPAQPTAAPSIVTGLTKELESHVANHLAQQI